MRARRQKQSEPVRRQVLTGLRDFSIALGGIIAAVALVNVTGAQAVPLPVVSLILPFDFGLTQAAVDALQGQLAASDVPETVLETASATARLQPVALTLISVLFSGMVALTLWLSRRARSQYVWRWSAHFD